MFTKRLLLMIGVMGLFASGGAAVADGVRDAGAKIRGDYGDRRMTTVYRPRAVYRETATAPAPEQARSFSLDPSHAGGGSPCQTAKPSEGVAQRPAQAQRSYSFEPGYESFRSSSRGFRSQTPAYLLPKSDPRKYRGW